MKAIILAAGRGSRMGDCTKEQPKCLTIVNGKTLIDQQILSLSKAGVKDIGIVTGYKAGCLKEYGTHQFHNKNWVETNMVASLLCAKEWLDESECIVSYSDIFYGAQIIKDLIICENNIAIAYDPNWLKLWSRRFKNPLDDAETFRIDNQGYVLEIGQKPSSIGEVQGQYMGLLKFKKGFWETYFQNANINSDIKFDKIDMTSFLNKLICSNYGIKALPNFDPWGEYDTESDIRIAND